MNRIKNNLDLMRKNLKSNQKICFVAKANCYGFGSEICQYFDQMVDYFAVSCAKEFFEIKKYVTKPIMILDTLYEKNELTSLIKNGCELTVSNAESLKILLYIDTVVTEKIKVHLAINTGMNRFGFDSVSTLKKTILKIKKSQNIVIVGVFSHLFAGKNENDSQKQINLFNDFCKIISKYYNLEITKHICATDGTIYNNFGDMVRIGYGLYDDKYFETITLKTKILDFQTLNPGEFAGYNAVFVAKKKTKLAVIGIGYGDGIFRNIVKQGYVLIDDCYAKIVAVCMDSILVDVSKLRCNINDDVVVIGKYKKNKISICDIATWCDTIGYEIIVRLSNRIERKYIGENKCKLLQENIEQENLSELM